MKSAGLLALALTGVLAASVAGAAGRRAQVAPNNIYVQERGGVPRAVMQQDGQWANLPPEAYAGGGYQGDPRQAGPPGPQQGQMMYPPEAYGQPGMNGDYYQGGMAGPAPMGPPVGAPGPQFSGPPPVPGRRPCGNPVVWNGARYCGGGVIVQEEGYEEEYIYREYGRVDSAPTPSPFGRPY